ncbi:helix-turn-helix domain-containing protein [Actinocorallia longicatena]|uniref:Helix-turn-helix domain-containing protein n=1 Tax=Actinocorallia longicatena TaxID=111803 RepID=A0ABP6QPL4_9ACTN
MSIGETLAEARRVSGLSLAQVSERTRIRETVIRCIESDDYSLCGGNFYARGHIRSIARTLGLDSDPLVREYDEAHGGAPAAISVATAFEPERPLRFRERRTPNWSAAMATALVLVVLYGVVQVFSQDHTRRAEPVNLAEKPPVTAPAVQPKTAPPTPHKDAVALAGKKDEVVVEIKATKACWVNIRDNAGKVLFSGMIPRSAAKEFKGRKRLRVIIGNGAAALLTVNGKKLGAIGKDGQVVRITFEPGVPDTTKIS